MVELDLHVGLRAFSLDFFKASRAMERNHSAAVKNESGTPAKTEGAALPASLPRPIAKRSGLQ
jgi:hypothetical protein